MDDLFYKGEGALVGSVIHNPNLYHEVSWLTSDNFMFHKSSSLWSAIKECVNSGMDINPLTLIGIDPDLSLSYIDEAVHQRLPDRNVVSAARSILNYYRLRKIGRLGRDIEDGLQNGAKCRPAEFVTHVQRQMTEIQGSQTAESQTRAKDVIQGAIGAVGGHTKPLWTPWRALTRLVSIEPSDYVLVAARPSMGKTSLAAQMMLGWARGGIPCAFFSLETSKWKLGKRLLVSASQTPINGTVPEKVARTAEQLKELPFFVYDSIYDIDGILNAMQMLYSVEGVRVFFVDYLQLVESNYSKDVANTPQILAKISRQFKKIANTLGVTMVLLSQMNRNIEHRALKRPVLADIRDSGSLEQDASHVWLLWSPNDDDGIRLEVAKQKDGPLGRVDLQFERNLYTFREEERDDVMPHRGDHHTGGDHW